MTVTTIIKTLKNCFIEDDNVYAIWIEGSYAIGNTDKYSDLDIWFDVEDGFEELTIKNIKKALNNISSLDFFFEKNHEHPLIRQYFIHLKETTKFLIIDLCIQSNSRDIKFTLERKDEEIKVLFDKKDVIQFKNINMPEFNKKVKKRFDEIINLYDYYTLLVEKELERENFLEAFNYYHKNILNSLIELYRIKYEPTKNHFGLKHIKRDLPGTIVDKLEYFHKINSLEDIKQKTKEVQDIIEKLQDSLT